MKKFTIKQDYELEKLCKDKHITRAYLTDDHEEYKITKMVFYSFKGKIGELVIQEGPKGCHIVLITVYDNDLVRVLETIDELKDWISN